MIIQLPEKPRIMVVEARFYDDISNNLLQGTRAVLEKYGCEYDLYEVPGITEVPAMIKYAIRALSFNISMQRYDAYVVLGCVLKGGEPEEIGQQVLLRESARGLTNLVIQYSLALGSGIFSARDQTQALAKSDPAGENLGAQAAEAALKMLTNKRKIGLYPRQVK